MSRLPVISYNDLSNSYVAGFEHIFNIRHDQNNCKCQDSARIAVLHYVVLNIITSSG